MKVLVADDDAESRRSIDESVRRWGYDVVVAQNGLDALQILLAPDPPQIALIDWMMPGLDGVQLCLTVRERKGAAYTYILMLTAKNAKADVIAGLEAGADDCIAKPFEPQELRVRLRTGKRILVLLDQLTSARETLRDLAARDALTTLWNHNAIIEQLANELSRAERSDGSVAVVLADLDNFKTINDTFGHPIGDRVLCAAAQALRGAVRPYDAVGRFGGEEFLMVLPGCDQLNAIGHGERLRHALSQVAVAAGDVDVGVTASFGMTVVGPGARVGAEAAIRIADAALYAAKRNGRNQVEWGDIQPEDLAILDVAAPTRPSSAVTLSLD